MEWLDIYLFYIWFFSLFWTLVWVCDINSDLNIKVIAVSFSSAWFHASGFQPGGRWDEALQKWQTAGKGEKETQVCIRRTHYLIDRWPWPKLTACACVYSNTISFQSSTAENAFYFNLFKCSAGMSSCSLPLSWKSWLCIADVRRKRMLMCVTH